MDLGKNNGDLPEADFLGVKAAFGESFYDSRLLGNDLQKRRIRTTSPVAHQRFGLQQSPLDLVPNLLPSGPVPQGSVFRSRVVTSTIAYPSATHDPRAGHLWARFPTMRLSR